MIKSRDITKSIIKMSEAGNSSTNIVNGVLKFTKKHNLQSLLKDIGRELTYFQKTQTKENSFIIKVANKEELSSLSIREIQKILKAENLSPEIIEDENLSSGFVAEYKNRVFNGSVNHQLKKMKEAFSQKIYQTKI